jgi:hypothetical protein
MKDPELLEDGSPIPTGHKASMVRTETESYRIVSQFTVRFLMLTLSSAKGFCVIESFAWKVREIWFWL